MFNDEQIAHMRNMASLPKEAKCDCGWFRRGECYQSCYGHPEKGGAPLPKCANCGKALENWEQEEHRRHGTPLEDRRCYPCAFNHL